MRTSNRPIMRFAYIDSNGNEVPIPSVDALALRIELGAITEQTQLYDAQADQWGAAHTHEIYHTLARAAGADDSYVAPPPVASAPVPPPPAPPSAPPIVEEDEHEEPHDREPAEVEPAAPVGGPENSFGLTLAEPPPTGEDDEEPGDAEDFGIGSAGALPAAEAPGAPRAASGASDAEAEDASFDFGDMEGGLELEEPEPSASGGFGHAPMGSSPDTEEEDEPALDFSGGMDVETSMQFGASDFDAANASTLDLETPMSQYTPAAPPAWMDPSGESGGDAVMDFSSVGKAGADGADDEVPLRDRRTPRNRPSRPKLRRQRNMAGPIIGVVALLAVGLGGYVAWPVVSATLASRGEPEDALVVLPEIPEELEPRMRSLASSAFATIYADARTAWAAENPVQAPPREWLAGVYLANAGDYEQVAYFWNDVADYLDGVRGVDLAAFDAAFTRAAEAEGVSPEDAALMRARADSGFVAAAPARVATYDRVQALVDAAIRLHRFLVANEGAIEYAPASSVTTDPVFEATASPEIEAAMHDLIDAVTRGLSAIGHRDAVTAEALWSTVLAEVQQSGIE